MDRYYSYTISRKHIESVMNEWVNDNGPEKPERKKKPLIKVTKFDPSKIHPTKYDPYFLVVEDRGEYAFHKYYRKIKIQDSTFDFILKKVSPETEPPKEIRRLILSFMPDDHLCVYSGQSTSYHWEKHTDKESLDREVSFTSQTIF